jgi:hypothetical protein
MPDPNREEQNMMVLKQRFLALGFMAFVALTAGCASGGGAAAEGGGEAGTSTQITVENIHPTSDDIQIFIMGDGAVARTPIGSVPRGETRSFTYEGGQGAYRLIAVRPVGETTSDRININHRQDFTWTIQGNRMLIRRR